MRVTKQVFLLVFIMLALSYYNYSVNKLSGLNDLENYHHATLSFGVSGGDCKECRKIILESVRKLSGMETVNWNRKRQSITVIYDPMVISPEEIKKAIANSGHDTDSIRAMDERYDLLPDCCKYERVNGS